MVKRNKLGVPRSIRSSILANLILYNDLFDDFIIWTYHHPKIKSMFRAGKYFLANRELKFSAFDIKYHIPVNMDTLKDYYRN